MPMVYVPVQCPHCQSTEVIKAGKQANGAQRYQCQNGRCERRIFLLQYQDRGRALEIRRQVVDMAINGSGIRDTARVLRITALFVWMNRLVTAPFLLTLSLSHEGRGNPRITSSYKCKPL
jgi:transposase-like protein